MFTECPFCHKQVLDFFLDFHIAKHTKLRQDGQMTDHLTLSSDRRYQGTLEGIPQVYEHLGCRGITQMPEEIIRSYLVNPFMYSEESFCAGCSQYVHTSALCWSETGESLFDYNQRLRQEHTTEDGINLG